MRLVFIAALLFAADGAAFGARPTIDSASAHTKRKADGAVVRMRVAGGAVDLQSWKIDAKRGLSDGQCDVTIGNMRIETYGYGDLEVYTCDGLAAAGILPPAGTRQRIGLIYYISTPNWSGKGALILIKRDGQWQLDRENLDTFDGSPASSSIPALRRALRPKARRHT